MRSLNRQKLLAWVCAAAVATAAGVAAGEGPEVAIRSHTVRVAITGRLARTTVEQVFVNYTGAPREATYNWRTSPEAAVCDLAMWVGGLRSPAEIHPRVAAEDIYRSIVHRRQDPALLVSLGGGRWQQQVFPIPPRGTQKVQVVIVQLLPVSKGQVTYEAPLAAGGSTTTEAQELDFSAEVAAPGGVRDVTGLTHALGVQRALGGSMTLGFRAENASLDKRLAFSFTPGQAPPEVVAFRPADGDALFAATLPLPEALAGGKRPARNVVAVVDASGSMAGERFKQARLAALETLATLTEADGFGVVLAGPDARRWRDRLVPATKANLAAAGAFLAAVTPAGGTDLAAAIRAAEGFNTDPRTLFDMFLFTDGRDRVGATPDWKKPQPEAGRTARKTTALKPAANCRVFALCPEDAEDSSVPLARLSERTGGAFRVTDYQTEPEVRAALAELLAEAGRVAIRDARLEVEPGDLDVRDFSHGLLRPGEPVALSGRYRRAGELRVTLRMNVEGKPASRRYELKLPETAAGGGAPAWAGADLVKVWAHLRAGTMWNRLQTEAVKPEDLEALIKLSKGQRVATRATALLVLESDHDYTSRGIARAVSFVLADENLASREEQWGPVAPAAEKPVGEVARLHAQAAELRRVGHYAQAAETLGQIVESFPNQYAAAAEAALLREFLTLRENVEAGRGRQEPDEPPAGAWQDMLLLPAAPEVIPAPARPGPPADITDPRTPSERRVLAKLQANLPKVETDKTPLKDVVEFFRDLSGLSIHVRWGALQIAGVDQTTPVSLKLRDVTVERALTLALEEAGGVANLGFVVEQGVVKVSTRDDLSRQTVTRVYDVRDLLPLMKAGQRERTAPQPATSGGGIFGSAPADTWGDSGTGAGEAGPARAANVDRAFADVAPGTRIYDISDHVTVVVPAFQNEGRPQPRFTGAAELLRTVRSTIATDTWIENSGTIGVLRELNGLLIVTQTLENHRALADLLAEIRRHKPWMRSLRLGRVQPDCEAFFSSTARIAPWVQDLLRQAGEGRLSEFSSVRLAQAGGRTFARINGLWLDASLTAAAQIHLVLDGSEAAAALIGADPGLRECFALGPVVVVRADDKTAFSLDTVGIADKADPRLKAVLAALAAGKAK